jgi:carboxyl-terminal processing protease
MKYRFLKLFPALAVILIITSFSSGSGLSKKQILISTLTYAINQSHFDPIPLNDELSDRVYHLYIKATDVSHRFYTQQDINELEKYRYQLDEAISLLDTTFFDISYNILTTRIAQIKGYYTEILSKPFDFNVDEYLLSEKADTLFAADTTALKEKWRKVLKYQTLDRLVNSIESQEKAIEKKDTTYKIKTYDQMEQEARNQVLKLHNDWFHRLGKLDRDDRFATYLNAIASAFDPHTEYFPPKEKEDFDINLSGRLEGIGATLQEKDGYIKVAGIVPGSPSWKQGQLKVGDIILKVAQGNDEPVDIVDMRIDNAVKLIRGKKGTLVNLTVRKIDGSVIIIPIIRDVVVIEETYAKSAVVKDEKTKTAYGYIKLPQFYADFNQRGGRSCSKDVKHEIEKLKNEKVKGIILDLRYNGGGSLQDVVDMAGLFIEKGPIVQVKSRVGDSYLLSDRNAEVNFSQPLIVLINNYSASASEIFAAAMQDYHRGIIMGGNTSYGKGTVQRFFDIDELLGNSYPEYKPMGSLKVTVQKFYRINGGSTQLNGVVPDIILPDLYTYVDEEYEKNSDYPLKWTKIDPADYSVWNPSYDLSKLIQKSNARTEKSPEFSMIREGAKRLKVIDSDVNIPMRIDKFRTREDSINKDNKKYENVIKPIADMSVLSTQSDLNAMASDSSKKARTDAWFKEIKKDVYIFEAVKVLGDAQ